MFPFLFRTPRKTFSPRIQKKDFSRAGTHRNPLKAEQRAVRGKHLNRLLWSGGLAGAAILVYWFFLSGAFAVKDIAIVGAVNISLSQVRDDVSTLLETRRMLLIPMRQSLWLVDRDLLAARLLSAFPLRAVQVKPVLPNTLKVIIEEHVPAYRVVYRDKQAGYINNEGINLGNAVFATSSLWIIENVAASSPVVGTAVITQPVMNFINRLQEASRANRLSFTITTLNLDRILVHDIVGRTAEGWRILLSDTSDASQQLLNVELALREMKEKRKTLEYIDVRIPTKIFYK